MSLDEKKWQKYDRQYPQASECISKSKGPMDARPSYEYLYNLRGKIPEELYAYYFRKLLQMNTANVPDAMRLKMFEEVKPENIMYQDELDAIAKFEEYITVYRGAPLNEEVPGICWTLSKCIAEDTFYQGRLFKARIPKKNILLYFAHEEAEEEIIVHVTQRLHHIIAGGHDLFFYFRASGKLGEKFLNTVN